MEQNIEREEDCKDEPIAFETSQERNMINKIKLLLRTTRKEAKKVFMQGFRC